jgi:hypothetical protein
LLVAQRTDDGRFVLQDGDVHALGMMGNVPLQHLQQRACVGGRPNGGRRRRSQLAADHRSRRARLVQRVQQVTDGIRLADHGDRQPGAKRALEAQDQLGASQAVDAQIPLEPARQGHLAGSRVLGMKLASQFADDREQGACARVELAGWLVQTTNGRVHCRLPNRLRPACS